MTNYTACNCQTGREVYRMMQNYMIIATVECGPQFCSLATKLPCHPHRSAIFHTWLMHGCIL